MENNFEITEDLLSKFLAGEASPGEAMAVEDWAAKSEANRIHLDTCTQIFGQPGVTLLLSAKQGAWTKIIQGIEEQNEVRSLTTVRWAIGIAASLIIVVAIGILLSRVPAGLRPVVYYATDLARHIQLNDATEVTVSPNSVLTVDKDFGKLNRNVKLIGSASFSVKHHNALSFVLDMDGFFVRDLGTRFSVRLSSNKDTVRVSVQEGEVSAYDAFGLNVIVHANEETCYVKSARKFVLRVDTGSAPKSLETTNRAKTGADTVRKKPNPLSAAGKLPQHLTTDSSARKQMRDSVKSTTVRATTAPSEVPADRPTARSRTECECNDTPPFQRFEKSDTSALSPSEYNRPDLLVAALASSNPGRRAMAVRQLGKLKLDKYVDNILTMMRDDDCVVRMEVVNALKNYRNDKIADMLVGNIHDPACFVREEIAGELKNYSSLNGVEAALITLAKDHSANVATQALYSLDHFTDDRVSKELLAHLWDKDEHPKVAAIQSLKNFNSDSIAVLLVAELTDPGKHVRQAAAEALKYYSPAISRPALLTRLKADTSEHVKLAIIESLAAVGDDTVIDSLVPFATDKKSIIRQMTVRTLGIIGGRKAIPYLETASHDENGFVRKEAIEALRKFPKN